MIYQHTIVATNRPDLLELAVESVRPLWRFTSILDNSPCGQIGAKSKWPVPVIRPSVPLSCAQSMNFLHRLAGERGADVFGYQHSDAQAQDDTPEKFLAALEALLASPRKWAAALTLYDILSAYPLAAVEDVGPWDVWLPNPNYHLDADWFRRAKLKGYELIETGLPVKHLDGGSTTVKESWRHRISCVTFPMNDAYYAAKWGGKQGEEKFATPWNQ
jgi:hypothetical protein